MTSTITNPTVKPKTVPSDVQVMLFPCSHIITKKEALKHFGKVNEETAECSTRSFCTVRGCVDRIIYWWEIREEDPIEEFDSLNTVRVKDNVDKKTEVKKIDLVYQRNKKKKEKEKNSPLVKALPAPKKSVDEDDLIFDFDDPPKDES